MKSIYIAITAHNPLHRVEKTLKDLKGYEDLELEKEVDIYMTPVKVKSRNARISLALQGEEKESESLPVIHTSGGKPGLQLVNTPVESALSASVGIARNSSQDYLEGQNEEGKLQLKSKFHERKKSDYSAL